MQKLKNIFLELTEPSGYNYELADKWGVTINLAFDLNGLAYTANLVTDKTYKPSPCAETLCEDEYIQQLYDSGKLDNSTIERLIRFCSKLLYILDKAELSY